MERDLLIGLVTRAQKGDGTAMDELFAAFYNDIYYFALKTVKDSDTACDITQETFLEIINTIGSLKEPAAFVTWMKQITYHQCTRYFKKKKDVLVEEDEEGNTIFDTLVDESEDSIPSEVYEKKEFRNTILEMINQLSEEQRSAVMMYYFDELSVSQIAQIQNVSEGTVKSRLNYARKAIKKSVETYEEKNDIKLHSFALMPLFALFFQNEAMPAVQAAAVKAKITAATSALSAGSAVAGASTVAGASAMATASTVSIGAKLAAIPLVAKIIAGITAVAIIAGAGFAVTKLVTPKEDHVIVDENYDRVCDCCELDFSDAVQIKPFSIEVSDRYISLHTEDGTDNPYAQYYLIHVEGNEYMRLPEEFPAYIMDEWVIGMGGCNIQVFAYNDAYGLVQSSEPLWYEIEGAVIPELKDFNLSITDNVINITYPDGGEDDFVEYYTLFIPDLGVEERFTDTVFDLSMYDFGDITNAYIEVYAWNETQWSTIQHSLYYNTVSGEGRLPATEVPAVPEISIVTNADEAVLTINPAEEAVYYAIIINGNWIDTTYETTYRITPDRINEGLNEVCVSAHNEIGSSENSNTVTTGKLAEPQFQATGTGVEMTWGDVENAEGYKIYGNDGKYLTSIGLGGSYDFASDYTAYGFYFPSIQAYAEGWMSSAKSGIPVTIEDPNGGSGGGYGIGCTTTHAKPTLSLDGTILTIISNDTDYYDNATHRESANVAIYIDGIRLGNEYTTYYATPEGTSIELARYLSGTSHTIKVVNSCQFHGDFESTITHTADSPSALELACPEVTIETLAKRTLVITPKSTFNGNTFEQTFTIFVDGSWIEQVTTTGTLYFDATSLRIEPGTEHTFVIIDKDDSSLSSAVTGIID